MARGQAGSYYRRHVNENDVKKVRFVVTKGSLYIANSCQYGILITHIRGVTSAR